MSKSSTLKNTNLSNHYIYTGSAKIHEIDLDELGNEQDYKWLEKSRQLRARRWRKIKQQVI
jgi:hypothetical protein